MRWRMRFSIRRPYMSGVRAAPPSGNRDRAPTTTRRDPWLAMATPRFRYSRWDGTQVGFELDADEVLEQITDDLLYHGDLNAALRRMLQQGSRTATASDVQGLREMLEKLRQRAPGAARALRPRRRLRRHRPGAARGRRPERDALDELAREAPRVGDPAPGADRAGQRRRAQHAARHAPARPGRQVRELQSTSSRRPRPSSGSRSWSTSCASRCSTATSTRCRAPSSTCRPRTCRA